MRCPACCILLDTHTRARDTLHKGMMYCAADACQPLARVSYVAFIVSQDKYGKLCQMHIHVYNPMPITSIPSKCYSLVFIEKKDAHTA